MTVTFFVLVQVSRSLFILSGKQEMEELCITVPTRVNEQIIKRLINSINANFRLSPQCSLP